MTHDVQSQKPRVFVTGGAGYVGSVLVPHLLTAGYPVTVYDLFLYGDDVLDSAKGNPNLTLVKGDIRDQALLRSSIKGCDIVIHLACISNDPSFELDPDLGRSINYDAFEPLVDIAKEEGVKRFIYASSSSVYGVKEEANVTEDLPLEPLTDYSRYKALCEEILAKKREPGFCCFIVRPATVCGYAPRLRLDLTVNILTNHAITNKLIKVFGGEQMRPNIHVQDMARLYLAALEWTDEQIDGKVYNVGYDNFTINEIATQVRDIIGDEVDTEVTPTNDNRSYHISSQRIKDDLGFAPEYSIKDAISELRDKFVAGEITDSMDNERYYNIKTMQALKMR